MKQNHLEVSALGEKKLNRNFYFRLSGGLRGTTYRYEGRGDTENEGKI